MRGSGRLGVCWFISLSLGLGVSAEAGSMPPHTIEDLLRETTDVILGKVAPGEFVYRVYSCDYSEVGIQKIDACPKTLIEIEVQAVLKGKLKPGDRITVMLNEGIDEQKGYRVRLSISPELVPEEPVLLFLTNAIPSPAEERKRWMLIQTPHELRGKVYHVVRDRMGKWAFYPDGVLRHGRYEPDKRIPVPLRAEEVFGPTPPTESPTVSIYEFRQYMKDKYGHKPPHEIVDEQLVKGEEIPNAGELTLKQMRQIVRRHLQGGK